METITSLIPNDEHIAQAQQKFKEAGFANRNISVLFKQAAVWKRLRGSEKAQVVYKDAKIGALLGLLVSALYGIPAGLFNCLYASCTVGLSITFWIMISLFWVAAGAALGAIIGLDQLEYDLYSYVEGVRRGEALFVVEASEALAPVAVRILKQEHGSVIHREPHQIRRY